MEAAEHRGAPSQSAVVSREIVRLHARLYGRGPTKAKAYVHTEYVLCVLSDIFTPSELTLIEAGNTGLVRETRSAFQVATRDEFIDIVEGTTGRRVRAFHSQIDPASNTGIELFLLEFEAKAAPDDAG